VSSLKTDNKTKQIRYAAEAEDGLSKRKNRLMRDLRPVCGKGQ